MYIPKPYQWAAVQAIKAQQGFLLADACGLGKTFTAIASVKYGNYSPNARILVVCPPHLVTHWYDEIAMQELGTEILVSRGYPYRFQEIKGWVISSYYEFANVPFATEVGRVLWDLVIIDEAHRIKNRTTKTARRVKQIPRMNSLAMTATPLDEKPDDIWSILNFTHPEHFVSYYGFVMKYMETRDDYWQGEVIVGPKDPKAFAEFIGQYMMRRTKEDVLPELPPRIDVLVRVPMDEPQKKVYDQIHDSDDIIANVEGKEIIIRNVLALITKLQQVTTDPSLLGFDVPSAKLLWVTDFLKDHEDEPIVIFTRFRQTALDLARKLDADYIVGGERSEGFDETRFHRLVGTIDAMGEGLNLQRADIVIFVDGHWATLKMTHAFDRVHRMNITAPKTVYMLYSSREDYMVYKAVQEKWTRAYLVYQYLEVEDGTGPSD